MNASTLIALIQLTLIGSTYLTAEACATRFRVRWGDIPLPRLAEWVISYWPGLVIFSIFLFGYTLTAQLRRQENWSYAPSLSLGLLYILFLFLVLIGVVLVTCWENKPMVL